MRLLSHWNLRDEIKADYDVPQNGLARQRAVQQVLERIVTQTIPEAVINNPQVDWNPWTNEVKPAAEKDSEFGIARLALGDPGHTSNQREPDTRYARCRTRYFAARKMDPVLADGAHATSRAASTRTARFRKRACARCWWRSSARRWCPRWRR